MQHGLAGMANHWDTSKSHVYRYSSASSVFVFFKLIQYYDARIVEHQAKLSLAKN